MFTCKFCSKTFSKNAGGMVHQNQCRLNPERKIYQLGRKAWNAGKSADTCESMRKARDKLSKTMTGRKPGNWNRNRESLRQYRTDCAFRFSVYDYPDKFDLSLIDKHGWYSAKNRGNNQTGVSRDHMVSVKYGWENGIAPEIISHPANCAIMLHSDNVRKYSKNAITLEQLLEKIKSWDSLGD